MLKMTQKALFGGCCFLLVIATSFANSMQCPSQDFETFFNAFSEKLEVQKAFTPETFRRTYWSFNDGLGDYEQFSEKVNKKDLTFPILINAAKREAANYQTRMYVSKDSDQVMYVDVYEEDSDVGWTYMFFLRDCWYLYNVESSLHED